MKVYSTFLFGTIIWCQMIHHKPVNAQDVSEISEIEQSDMPFTDKGLNPSMPTSKIVVHSKSEEKNAPVFKETGFKATPTTDNIEDEKELNEQIERALNHNKQNQDQIEEIERNLFRKSNMDSLRKGSSKFNFYDYNFPFGRKEFLDSESDFPSSIYDDSSDFGSKFSSIYGYPMYMNPYAHYTHALPSKNFASHLHKSPMFNKGLASRPSATKTKPSGGRHILPMNKNPRDGEERYEELLYKEIYKFPEGTKSFRPFQSRNSHADDDVVSCMHDDHYSKDEYEHLQHKLFGMDDEFDEDKYYIPSQKHRSFIKNKNPYMHHKYFPNYDRSAKNEPKYINNFRSAEQSGDGSLSDNIQQMIDLNKKIMSSLSAPKLEEFRDSNNDQEFEQESRPSNKMEFILPPDENVSENKNLMILKKTEDERKIDTDNLNEFKFGDLNTPKFIQNKPFIARGDRKESKLFKLKSDSESNIDDAIMRNVKKMNELNAEIMSALSPNKIRSSSIFAKNENLNPQKLSLFKKSTEDKYYGGLGSTIFPEIAKKPYLGLLSDYKKDIYEDPIKDDMLDKYLNFKHGFHCLDNYLGIKKHHSFDKNDHMKLDDYEEYDENYKPKKKHMSPLLDKLMHYKKDLDNYSPKEYKTGLNDKLLHKLMDYDKDFKDKLYSKDKDDLLHKLLEKHKKEYFEQDYLKPKPEDYGYGKDNEEYSYVKSILANEKGKPMFTDQLELSPNIVYGPAGNNIPYYKYSSDYSVPSSNVETSRGLSYPTSYGMALYPEFGKPQYSKKDHISSHPSMAYTSVY